MTTLQVFEEPSCLQGSALNLPQLISFPDLWPSSVLFFELAAVWQSPS